MHSAKASSEDVARGFFITFEGGEGAGKSTQIHAAGREAARQALSTCW